MRIGDGEVPSCASTVDHLARVFAALGHPIRLRLLSLLLEGERSEGDCACHVELPLDQVGEHLAELVSSGCVLASVVDGQRVFALADRRRAAMLVFMARSIVSDKADNLNTCGQVDLRSGSAQIELPQSQ